jgi:peptide/nickel transport system substrate-binding protein
MATLLPEAERKGFQIWNGGPAMSFNSLIFNQEPGKVEPVLHKLFTNKRFRQAVSCLIDRQTIINQVMDGFGEPFYHFVAENNKYYNPQYATPYHYNPQKAREIFQELGLKDVNNDTYLEDDQGNPIFFKIMYLGTDQTYVDMINIIVDNFKAVGIKSVLEIVDMNVLLERMQYTHDWQCTLRGFSSPTFTEQWTNVWPSYGDRHYWYPNQTKPATDWEARIDEIHKQLIHTYDAETTKKLYDEFQQIIMDQLPFIPIYRGYSFFAVYKKWGNVNWDVQHEAGDLGGVRLYVRDNAVQP